MTKDGGEEPRETEAEHCTQEEHPKNHLLLERGHEVQGHEGHLV